MLPSTEALRTLAAWAPALERSDFRVGEWHGGSPDANGVIQMPFMELSAEAERFVADMYRVGLVHDLDWGTWLGTERGRRLSTDGATIASASADELAALLTAIIRSERFGDGQIEGAHERGLLQAAARRAAALIESGAVR